MSSITFDRKISDAQLEAFAAILKPSVADNSRFLFDSGHVHSQKDCSRLARETNSIIKIEINPEGEVKTMSDGTKYKVNHNGVWVKI